MSLDFSSEFGQRVLQRLETEQIIWLTTVDPSGTPQPIPVWFLWHDQQIYVYSEPKKAKLRNIAQNPNVALNLHATPDGEDVVVLIGKAELIDTLAAVTQRYEMKYADGFVAINMTPAQFEESYSQLIRITPNKLRGF